MKQWMKKYFVYVVLALSLLVNATLLTKNTQIQNQLSNLQSQMAESAVGLKLYDGNEELIKTVTFLPSDANISLYTLLSILNERDLLKSSVATSGWIMALNELEGIGGDNKYWIIFSSTNAACAGFSDPGYDYPNVCNVGSKDIIIGFHDEFEFRLLAWNS